MQSLADALQGFTFPAFRDDRHATEYSDLCNDAAKIVGQPYIVMHKRLERMFRDRDVDAVLSYLRRWIHEAGKSNNPGLTLNVRMKQYRDALEIKAKAS